VCGLWSMFAASSIEVVCAIHHTTQTDATSSRPLWPKRATNALLGVTNMLPAYAGIPMVPYIVASMLHPQKAKDVLSRSCRITTLFNLLIGVVCFLGWGTRLLHEQANPDAPAVRTVVDALRVMGYSWAAPITALAFLGRALTSYGLYYWLISRELESCMPLDAAPQVALGLPWAIRRVQHKKLALRCGIVLFTVIPLFMPPHAQTILERFFMAVPMNLTNVAFPACLAMSAIMIHSKRINATGESHQDGLYFCGNLRNHIMLTLAVAVIMCIGSAIILAFFIFRTHCYLVFGPDAEKCNFIN